MRLNDRVLRETRPEDGHVAFWVPGNRTAAYQDWERVATSGEARTIEKGVCMAPAMAVPARQPLRRFFAALMSRFRERSDWLLPNGKRAQQSGERRTDVVIVWSEADHVLDEDRVRSYWQSCPSARRIGDAVWIVYGAELDNARVERVPAPGGCPRAKGEHLLALARSLGDTAGEAAALTDLGIMSLRENDPAGAAARFEEALVHVRRLGDRAREHDILGNLGMAVLALGQIDRAQELFRQELEFGRHSDNPFVQKIALERIGLVEARVGNANRALDLLQEALKLARTVGDRQHEAELLWEIAIQHAEAGRRTQAAMHAHAAIELLQSMADPKATVLATHLHAYRSAQAAAQQTAEPTPSAVVVTASPMVAAAANGRRLLQMALSATKSFASFVHSGCKTVSTATHRRRLETCAVCVHHTGLRCKVCNCFTDIKSRLAHEDCPIGRWDAEAARPKK